MSLNIVDPEVGIVGRFRASKRYTGRVMSDTCLADIQQNIVSGFPVTGKCILLNLWYKAHQIP